MLESVCNGVHLLSPRGIYISPKVVEDLGEMVIWSGEGGSLMYSIGWLKSVFSGSIQHIRQMLFSRLAPSGRELGRGDK